MPKLYSFMPLFLIFAIGCQSMTAIEKIESKNTVLVSSTKKEIYDPSKDQNVLNAFDTLYELSPTEEEISFEASEFIYFDTPQKTPIRKAYSVLYKAAHKQRLALAPFCAEVIKDANCNQWWKVKHCDAGQSNCKTKITPATAGYRTGCLIENKTTYTRNEFPIGKNYFTRKGRQYEPKPEALSKAEQLENFFRIECS